MNDTAPHLKQLNRTFIGSVLFIDIVGYSTCTVPDQLEMKELFNVMLGEAVQNVAPGERIMVDTGDGAGIAFLGDPEDALFAALSLRDSIEASKLTIGVPGFVRMGINLGPLKIVRDINGHTNMIGDGVNDAQRVMSFSEPGQVMVSHSYFDIISRFSRDYTQLFVYEGTRQDKHVREHEVYRFGPQKDSDLAEKLRDRSRARNTVGAELLAPTSGFINRKTAASGQSGAQAAMKTALRPGLIASLIGGATLVGAVWSWTGKPVSQPAILPAAQAPASITRESVPHAPKTEAAQQTETKIAARNPDAFPTRASASATSSAPQVDSADKAAKHSEAPAKPGTVTLAIRPWGEVYVDGGKRGVSPPMKSISLAPGKHRIEIRNGDFAPYRETIEVKSGAETTVQYVF